MPKPDASLKNTPQQEQAILESWQLNAKPWQEAIEQQQIESRNRVSNGAIVDAVSSLNPSSVLDVGCGEGWLCRSLQASGVETVGIDASPELVSAAQALNSGAVHSLSYQELGQSNLGPFDVAVANFSLLGEQSVVDVFAAMKALLSPQGHFVVQTLHPAFVEGIYQDAWREGSWQGFSEQFSKPAPWYFRTLASWYALFHGHDLQLLTVQEPLHPDTGAPVSIIFTARR